MSIKKSIFHKMIRHTLLQHLLFWLVAWYIMLRLLSNSSEISSIDYLYTSVFLFPVALSVYINVLLLIPHLLSKRKYIFYLLILSGTVAFSAWLNMIIFAKLIDYLLPGYYFISYFDYTDLLKIFAAFTVVTTLIELSKGWFQLAEARNKLILLQKEHTEAELHALKTQINPHFLFNSLNSIYSLVITKSGLAPAYILKLSEFLRYVLYETSFELVTLEKELSSIKNYIEIQKLRVGDNMVINYQTEGVITGKMIAPLMFLPLIENAFKHGYSTTGTKGFVSINIRVSDADINFSIENSTKIPDSSLTGQSGIGLDNLKKRLERLYPSTHNLKIFTTDHTFVVNLVIPLRDKSNTNET